MNNPAKLTRFMAWRMSVVVILLTMLALSACTSKTTTHKFNARNITGVMPSLAFTLINQEGAVATAADFKHKTTLLYFGFTHCRDVCPVTLANLVQTLRLLGPAADSVRVLFVSIDPKRDTPQVLKSYTAAFAPQMVGLTGTDDQLTELTKRFRVAYRRDKPMASGDYEVYHSSAIFVFDGDGNARLLVTPPETNQQLAQDIKALMI